MKKDWVKNKLKDSNMNKKLVYSMLDTFNTETNSNWTISSYERLVRKCYNELNSEIEESVYQDNIEEIIKLEVQNQKKQDLNTYYRRINREIYRNYNIFEEIYSQFVNLLPKVDTSTINIKEYKVKHFNRVGIMQLSDIHFNTLVDTTETSDGYYNMDIASKRLKKYVGICIEQFKKEGIKKVYIVNLGDYISSIRREDEKLATATSTALSSIILSHILKQMVLELISNGFEVFITGVIGNESRISKDISFNAILSADNWDFIILNILSIIFKDVKNVKVLIGNSPLTTVISIPLKNENFNLLLAHGHTIKKPVEGCEKIFTDIYTKKGITIDLTLCGHFHHFLQFPNIIFNGSVIGDNSYSHSLGFVSKPSQNCIVINDDKSYYCYSVDLEDISMIKEGYKYDEIYEPYAYMINSRDTKKITIEMF